MKIPSTRKYFSLLITLCLAASWLSGCFTAPEPVKIAVIATPFMNFDRAAHTATRLTNGKILLAGGFSKGEKTFATAEIYDPQTSSFHLTGAMSTARQSHSATLLPDGKVLVAGGYNGAYLNSAEVYDPETGLFNPAHDLQVARSNHIAITLDNGKVLIAGGTGEGWTFLDSAELYDPATGDFSLTGSLTAPRESHTATLLSNGEVLITGGHQGRRANTIIYDSAELYNPVQGTFSQTGKMTVKRHKHDATILSDGRVLITGGADERDSQGAYRTSEIYHPGSGSFTRSGEMNLPRYKHTGTSLLLGNGEILLTAGANLVEVFNPSTGEFRSTGEIIGTTRFFATTTLLLSGDILFAGGYGTDIAADKRAWVLHLSSP